MIVVRRQGYQQAANQYRHADKTMVSNVCVCVCVKGAEVVEERMLLLMLTSIDAPKKKLEQHVRI